MSEPNPQKIEQLTERLSAYLDGELGERERRQVEATLSRDETARRVLHELRAVSAAVRGLPVESSPADIRERVLRALERRELLEPMPGEPSSLPLRPAWRFARLVASAAIVALAASVGFLAIRWGLQRPADIQVARLEERTQAPPAPAAKSTRRGAEIGEELEYDGALLGERASDADSFTDVAEPQARQWRIDSVGQIHAASLETEAKGETSVLHPDRWTRQHFDAVQPQIIITVADSTSERAAQESVKRFFVTNRMLDARQLPPQASLAHNQLLYAQGQPGVNISDFDGDQFLMRAPPHMVDQLVRVVQTGVPEARIDFLGADMSWSVCSDGSADSADASAGPPLESSQAAVTFSGEAYATTQGSVDSLSQSGIAEVPSPANVGARVATSEAAARQSGASGPPQTALEGLPRTAGPQATQWLWDSARAQGPPIDVVIKLQVGGPATQGAWSPSTRPASGHPP